MDYLKRFLGLSDSREQFNRNQTSSRQQNQNDSDQNNSFPNQRDDLRRPNFHVFSDPLHMHQYFEHQMNEMLKFFGFQEFDNGFFSNFYSNEPALQEEFEFNKEESSPKNLRDQFLKNGYEKPSQKNSEKMDKDIDGRVQLGDLNSIFGKNHDTNSYENGSGRFFFGQSQSIKTIKNPDGSVETHRTVKDNDGNEETTVCRRIGDKEYCVIKKRDKYGKEEITEKLINIDETEKHSLFKIEGDKFPTEKHEVPSDFPFDKFFK